MQFSDEELIAFLLADASRGLEERIRSQLDTGNAELIERLANLRMVLGHIDSLDTVHEPPSGLVEGTLDRIDAASSSADNDTAEDPDRVQPASTLRLTPAIETPRSSRHTLWDSTALTLSLSLLCCLALPALVRARFEARREQCEQHLAATGRGLTDYAMNSRDGRFPRVPSDGPAAFAGIYAIRLSESGRLDSWEQLTCPSLPFSGVRNRQTRLQSWNSDMGYDNVAATPQNSLCNIPSVAELGKLPPGQLAIFQFYSGGDYAYNLGVIEEPRDGNPQTPVPPKNAGRSYFAILADAPLIRGTEERFLAHDGCGINILYEDGSVRFVKLANLFANADSAQPLPPSSPIVMPALQLDHPFRNLRGQHQVGLHTQDASLAPSHFRPLGP